MKLYAGTTEQFRADARMHPIAEKLRAEYTTQIGHRPAPSEVASWQNSLMERQLESSQQWPLGSANVAVRGPHGRVIGPLRSVTP